MDIPKALHAVDLLSDLAPALLDDIAGFTTLRSMRAGETIFCQGEPSPYCFGIVSGEVAIERVSRDRRDGSKVLSSLGAGAWFGESAIVEVTPRAAMASAAQDGQLVVIHGQKLREWILRNPEPGMIVQTMLVKNLLHRLEQTSRALFLMDGVDRFLGGAGSWAERCSKALEFLKNSINGVDALFLFQRSSTPPYFMPVAHLSTLSELKTLPIDHPLLLNLDARREVRILNMPEDRQVLEGFSWIPDDFHSLGIFPLHDPADPTKPLQGVLIFAYRRIEKGLTRNTLLPSLDAARQIAQALFRRCEHEPAS